MNFLAHLHLSGNDPDIMTGNFIGDFVKGRNLLEQFDSGVARGIELHRSIDAFTDSNVIVSLSKKRLWPKYRHYSGVIVDIYYDHFLARNWNTYHTVPLPSYATQCYAMLINRKESLPKQVQLMLPYMVSNNWLVNYASIEGIHRALSGMARRASFVSKMEEAVIDLEAYYGDFQQEFDGFYPQLINHSIGWLKTP